MPLILKYILSWFGMMIIAIMNGTARDFIYGPLISDTAAHQVSTIILILLFAIYFYILTKKWPISSSHQAWLIGTIWLAMTLLFETVMGLFISGLTWKEILRYYNFFEGNLWILIPLWTFAGPYVFYRFQQA